MQITPEWKKIQLKWTLEVVKHQQLSILLTQLWGRLWIIDFSVVFLLNIVLWLQNTYPSL